MRTHLFYEQIILLLPSSLILICVTYVNCWDSFCVFVGLFVDPLFIQGHIFF